VEHAREKHELSERDACRLVNQWRGTQRYLPIQRVDEDALTRDIITLASQYGRYGYRRITALLAGGERSSTAHLAPRRAAGARKTKTKEKALVQ
jgi:hypothetical protein